MDSLALGAAGVVVIGGVTAYVLSKPTDPTSVQIQTATQSGKVPYSSTLSLPRSFNQAEGATFSFEGWFVVNDFTYGYGTRRLIFTHGDCPGLYLDSTSNSILVVVNTYGASESVLVSNIPAQKWIHFAVVVTQYTADIYINGILRQHHTLTQLPKQADEAVQIGSELRGFDGQVGGVTYYSRSLTPTEVSVHAASAPPPSIVKEPSSGQYLDLSWYTGR
jgi:hypothetical protein